MTNVATLLTESAERYADRPVIILDDTRMTYAQLNDLSARAAAMLKAQGIKPGDRVAMVMPNVPHMPVLYYAILRIGAIVVPLNPLLTPRELTYHFTNAEVSAVLTWEGMIDASQQAAKEAGDIPVVSIGAQETMQKLQGVEPDHEMVDRDDDDTAVLLYTSGTTGKPKGVRLSHGNIFWNAFNVDSLVDTRRRDINYAVAPLFHIGALNSFTVRAMVRGNTTVIRRGFVPSQVLADIENYGVNNAFFVPAMLLALTHDPEFKGSKLDSLRALICAGAPVPPVVISLFESKNVPVQQAWGLTETAPFATYLPTELTYEKAGSAGLPMPHTQVRVVDPATGEPIEEPHQRGELWVSGPNVTGGYWEDEGATAAAFTDDWFHTGDIGYRDEDGYYYVVDRLKDMIITGGENVYPAEIERVLAEHPDISDAAVVGAPDEEWGERIVAVLQPQPGHEVPSIEELRQFCSDRLARYKLPKDLVTVEEVPRNGSGKLDKVAIRQLVQG